MPCGSKPGSMRLQVIEAAHQESGAGEQDQGERDFAHHQHRAQAIAAEADGVAAAAVAQGRHQVCARHVERRREAEEQAGENRDGAR